MARCTPARSATALIVVRAGPTVLVQVDGRLGDPLRVGLAPRDSASLALFDIRETYLFNQS